MDSEEILLMRGASYLLPDPGGEVVRDLLNELDRLLAALAEAERDISRLDYLQSISVDSAELFPDMPRALVFRAPYDGDRALSVRAAIDAAMAWEKG